MNSAPDAVGEMKMDITGYDASIGHTLGVSITTATKGGTNELHGAVRWNYQDTRWDALSRWSGLNYRYQQSLNNCVNGPTTSPTCYAIENRYGKPERTRTTATPILAAPSTFPIFLTAATSFSSLCRASSTTLAVSGTANATVPTPQELAGNFSDYLGVDKTSTTPSNWTTQCPGGKPTSGNTRFTIPFGHVTGKNGAPQRQPFCGNQIPAGLQTNSAMVKFYNADYLPLPNR